MSQSNPNPIDNITKELLDFSVAGQIQSGRNLAALQSRYVAVEERSQADWLAYLHAFASKIQFINSQGIVDDNWQTALPEPNQIKSLLAALKSTLPLTPDQKALMERPDFAAILGFLQMLDYPLEQFWRFTTQHQQYYYKDILLFSPKPPKPDTSYLVLTLDSTVSSLQIPKDTLFQGGEDQAGNTLTYTTTIPRLLNQSKVDKIQTLSRYSDSECLLLTHCLDTEQKLEISEQGNLTFGEKIPKEIDTKTQSFPTIGFSLASPTLYLSGGTRILIITFTFIQDLSLTIADIKAGLKVSISTTDSLLILGNKVENVTLFNWSTIQSNKDQSTSEDPIGKTLVLHITLDPLFPAINTYQNEAQPALPKVPYLAFEVANTLIDEKLKTEKDKKVNLVKALLNTKLQEINLNITVEDAPGLITSNENGALESAKPSTPFTFSPRISTAYEFTHPELLIKPIDSAKLNFYWLEVPNDWNQHYKPYSKYRQDNEYPINDTWPATVDIYHSDRTQVANTTQNLFGKTSPYPLAFINTTTQQKTPKITSTYEELPLDTLLAPEWPIWFSLRLNGNDFGHTDYPQVIQYHAYQEKILESKETSDKKISNAQPTETTDETSENTPPPSQASISNEQDKIVDDSVKDKDINPQAIKPEKEIVQPPYTPTLDKVTLNYQSTINFITQPTNNRHQLHHIHPLGRPLLTSSAGQTIALLPEFNDRGYLYIGLSEFKPPAQCTLYFQMDPVDGHNIKDEPKVRWYYLQGSVWERFDKPENTVDAKDNANQSSKISESAPKIIEDSTQRLQDSGLVTFELPALTAQQNFIGDDRFWLRLSISEDSVNTGGDAPIPQPALYSRIRHVAAQGVAVTLTGSEIDPHHYEQPLAAESITELVEPEPRIATIEQPYSSFGGKPAESAEKLPIRASERIRHKNRALTAWDYEHLVLAEFPELYLVRCYRTKDTSTTLVVVPINHDPKILQPKVPLYLKQKIQDYVNTVSPLGLTVKVTDPTYLAVQLKVIVKVAQSADGDKVKVDINKKIIAHLTPWNKDTALQSPMLRNNLNLAEISGLIERDPNIVGVAKVTELSSLQKPLTPNQIIVPANNHEILLMDKETNYLEGVNVWELGFNFKVS